MKKNACLNDYLTVEECAELKKCTAHGIRKAIKERRLVADRKGRQWLIHRTDFDKFLAEES